MNIIESVTNRIESYRKENKSPCKSYATEAAAEKAVAKVAQIVSEHHMIDRPANYIVFFNEAWGRWNAAIDLTGVVNHPKAAGGYIGLAASMGFYTY
jgi:hypothetical protein